MKHVFLTLSLLISTIYSFQYENGDRSRVVISHHTHLTNYLEQKHSKVKSVTLKLFLSNEGHETGDDEYTSALADIAANTPNLTELSLQNDFRNITPLQSMKKLTTLNLSSFKLENLTPLKGCKALRHLTLKTPEAKNEEAVIRALKGLQSLEVSKLSAAFAKKLPKSLQALTVRHYDHDAILADLAQLTHLRHLDLKECAALTDLTILSGMTRLDTLGLHGATLLSDIHHLEHVNDLSRLAITNAPKIKDISILGSQNDLRHLDLSLCSGIKKVDPIAGQVHMQTLNLQGLKSVTSFRSLAALQELRELNLSYNDKLQGLQFLKGMPLDTLYLNFCPKVKNLATLKAIPTLRHVELEGSESLEKIPALAANKKGASGIEWLSVAGSRQLSDISGVAQAPHLVGFNASRCESLVDVAPLSAQGALQAVDLSGTSVRDLTPLAKRPTITRVAFANCADLSTVPSLKRWAGLQYLDLSGCSNLRDGRGLLELPEKKKGVTRPVRLWDTPLDGESADKSRKRKRTAADAGLDEQRTALKKKFGRYAFQKDAYKSHAVFSGYTQ